MFDEYTKQIGVHYSCRHVGFDFEKHMDHWTVVVNGTEFDFYMGTGFDGAEPSLQDVIYSLLSDMDAGQLEFEEFCDNYGYDSGSRRDYSIWSACAIIETRMRGLFSAGEIERMRELLEDY